MNPDFITVQEASEFLRVSLLTVYRYIKAQKLPAYKIGRDFRIKRSDFDSFVASKKWVE